VYYKVETNRNRRIILGRGDKVANDTILVREYWKERREHNKDGKCVLNGKQNKLKQQTNLLQRGMQRETPSRTSVMMENNWEDVFVDLSFSKQ
jgi:hypothetical protein